MTATEKILAEHARLKRVEPGQIILARVDLVLANDITGIAAIQEFEKIRGASTVFDPSRIVFVPDHFVPNKDIQAARNVKKIREFALKFGTHYFEVGRMGVEHVILPENGFVVPGELVVGADSHTCTYGALGAFSTGVGSTDVAAAFALGEVWLKVPATMKVIYRGKPGPWVSGKDLILHTIGKIGVDGALYMAMEFVGEVISELSMADRFTMANMAVEAGAKSGFFEVDSTTEEYLRRVTRRPYVSYKSDPDAAFARTVEVDVDGLEPQVAFPHLPENVKGVSEVGDVPIDQVVIGSCTNGRLEDLRVAAKILEGKEVHPRVRAIVIPGSQAVYAEALKEGLIRIFIEARCAVSTPTCGPCIGGYMGILAPGERCVSTTNRNFVGRMGDPSSEVYLASPAVAAASAVAGRIVGPDQL